MRELDQILNLWRELSDAGKPSVLATVVKTQGSSYRLPGARLLVGQDGCHAGTISGGCLEEEILRKAWWFTENGPLIRKYDTTPDGEIATEGYGLGCGGLIHVLLERVSRAQSNIFALLTQVRQRRLPALVAHLLGPSGLAGRRLTIDVDGCFSDDLPDQEIRTWLHSELSPGLAEFVSEVIAQPEIGAEAFLERLTPPVRLLVFGAGDDAIPLTQIANFLGWQVSVFDGRAHYAKLDKFPGVQEVIVRRSQDPVPLVDPWTAAVVMTHSYSQDLDTLKVLSAQPLRYLGILGPRKRTAELLADAGFSAEGDLPPSLYTPTGLDIGADGPHQVALAVAAEIQSVLNGRPGGSLRNRAGSIHSVPGTPESIQKGKLASPSVRSIVCA